METIMRIEKKLRNHGLRFHKRPVRCVLTLIKGRMIMDQAKRTAIFSYLDENPREIFSNGYDDIISDEMAGMLLRGEFDKFSELVSETVTDMNSYNNEFWGDWEEEYARHFGYGSWDDIPDEERDLVTDNRNYDESDWLNNAIRHWNGNVVATVLKDDDQSYDRLIYAPSGSLDEEDKKLATWLIDTFDPTFVDENGDQVEDDERPVEEKLVEQLDVIYGGYDREHMVVCGKVDLLQVWKDGKTPSHIDISPEDIGNILFYETTNGCGNMGEFRPSKTVTLPVELSVDAGNRSIDACYGFTGKWWRHDLRITSEPVPENDLNPQI